MPIMAISAGIGGVGSILGGIFGGKQAKKAGQIIQQAGQQAEKGVNTATQTGQMGIASGTTGANTTLQGIYAPLNTNLNPYLQAGQQGATSLMGAVAPGGSLAQQFSFNPQDIYNDPSYKFNLQQGEQAVQRSAAATGSALGAGTQKSLAQFASGLASNEYQNAFNRSLTSFQTNRTNTMQNLQALLGTGQFGTQQANQLGTGFGGMMSQNTMQGALSSANLGLQGAQMAGQFGMQGAQGAAGGVVGSTNAYNSILPGIGSAIQGYGMSQMYGNYMNGGGGGSYSGDPNTPYFNPATGGSDGP